MEKCILIVSILIIKVRHNEKKQWKGGKSSKMLTIMDVNKKIVDEARQ